VKSGIRPDGGASSFYWRWGPLILWMLLISGLSTDAFSAAETGRLLLPLLRFLFPNMSPATLILLHGVTRKAAHVAEFAILALLWYRALDPSGSGWQTKTVLRVFILAAAFGALDEAHQLFVPSRTASIGDVGWDSLGAVLGLMARHVTGCNGEALGRQRSARPRITPPGAR
jgi:VanZ family protein